MGGRTVAVQFISAALELAQAKGHDVDRALQTAGIAPALVAHPAGRVTEFQAARLIQALWDITDDELVGAGPKPVPRGTFRMIALAVIHTPDLAAALHRLVEFGRIGMGLDGVELTQDGPTARLSVVPRGEEATSQHIAAILLAVVHRFAGWLIGRQIVLTSAQLPGAAPPDAGEYLHVYGIAPLFRAPTAAITFDSRTLRLPLIQNETTLDVLLRGAPNALLFRFDYHPTASSRVRRILERSTAPEAVSVETTAAALSISAQHLRRLLRDEGSSFRGLKEDVLRDEAVASLVGGQETVDALSERLGFSEPSAFRRAFRRWTGSPPSAYRRQG